MRRAALLLLLTACQADAGAGTDARVATTWNHDIAPLVHEHCSGCHSEGGPGPFSLLGYDDAAPLAPLLASVTGSGRMPPWPAATGCRDVIANRRLDAASIRAFADWAADGAPIGDPPAVPFASAIAPERDELEASLTLRAPSPRTIAPGPDEYRCFASARVEADTYLTAFQVRADNLELVHHIQLYVADDAPSLERLEELDEADPDDGFACPQGPPARYVDVWSHGDLVRRYPPGVGQFVAAGSRLVYQLHYHPGTTVQTDHTAVDLQLAASVDEAARIAPVSNYPLELPPGQAEVSIVREHSLDGGLQHIVGARLHMHSLGASARLELVRGDTSSCLLDIPRWDFEWQMFYFFARAVEFEPGDRLRLTCRYDTTSRSESTRWGSSTDDEMCIGYAMLTPR